ncbi:uncharacterized protein N0V89_007749 [Didymosphaeria variabile]|uniref:Uncharacterized protein n=1 Tax=Didymosphaeria variabile TaxID=1932322 RepID=A0A9W8XLF7_9PLEO|nr:uncharacterized protein N0V89_007749 [Didymosphaeria variabile]KAJ4352401.1 hypothetical protein N0V89_007749 [Didymosphaeria variabile]
MVHPSYEPIPASESDEKLSSIPDARQARLTLARTLLPWLAHVVFFTISLTTLFSGLYFHRQATKSCIEKVSAYSPALSTVEYYDTRYNGSLAWPSPFRGAPSPEVDEAWARYTDVSMFTVDLDTVLRIGKDPTLANLLRMYTHLDYYSALEPAFSDP